VRAAHWIGDARGIVVLHVLAGSAQLVQHRSYRPRQFIRPSQEV
jgi:hypothetical protein